MPRTRSLTETIKNEVLADLNQSGQGRADPALIASIKNDVLAQIEAEQEAMEARQGQLRTPYEAAAPTSAVDRAVVDTIKNELLTELETPRPSTQTSPNEWRQLLSDRSIDRRIDRQYGNLANLRAEIRRGLQAVQDSERRLANISDPQVRAAVYSIIEEARQEGIPLQQVIGTVKAGGRPEGTWSQRIGNWFGPGAGRGFLGGLGVSLLAALLFPATRGGLRNIGVKMMEGTADLADQTRSAFGRAKEGFEDMIAEANFNNLQENLEENQSYPQEQFDPATVDNPLDDHPVH